jgi:hypothetical protein
MGRIKGAKNKVRKPEMTPKYFADAKARDLIVRIMNAQSVNGYWHGCDKTGLFYTCSAQMVCPECSEGYKR